MVQLQKQGAESSQTETSKKPGTDQAGEAMMQRVYRRPEHVARCDRIGRPPAPSRAA